MKRKLSTVIILLLVPVVLSAMDMVSPPLAREASIAAARVIDSYENCSKVTRITQEEFKNLFSDTELKIYNDLTGLSAKLSLSVSDYAAIMVSQARSCKTTIKNVRKQGVSLRDDGAVVVSVKMWKSIEYTNRRNVFFSSSEIYGADHVITMEIVYYPSDRKAYIESLKGYMDSEYDFPEPYQVVLEHRNDKINRLVRLKNAEGKYDSLRFNSRGQAFIRAGVTSDDWLSWDPSNIDIVMTKNNDGLLNLNAKHFNGRFEPYGAISLMSPAKLSCSDENVKNSSITYEGGFNLGAVITSKTQTHFGIFTGLGYSCTIFDFKRNISSSFTTASDTGSPVTLTNAADLSQSITTQWFYLPFFFRLEFISRHRVKPQIDLGVRFYCDPSALLPSVFYSGLSVIHAAGSLNGEAYECDILHQTTANRVTIAEWYLSGFASLGIDVSITKRLGAFANLSYEMSFLSDITDNAIVENSVSGDIENPVEYMFSTGAFQAYGPLSPSFTAKKSALMLKLGLSLKF